MCDFPFAPIQILTGDTRKVRNARHGRLHDDGRSFQPKSRIERRFESSPESRGSQTSGVLPVLFVQAKRIKPFSLSGKIRGSANLESVHQNSKFAQTNLNPFEPFLSESFAPSGAAHSVCFFRLTAVFPVGNFRGFANLEASRRRRRLRTAASRLFPGGISRQKT